MNKLLIIADKTSGQNSTIDVAGAIKMFSSWADPVITILLYVIPALTTVALLSLGVRWFFADEMERERHRLSRSVKRIIGVGIFFESLPAILKLVNLYNS